MARDVIKIPKELLKLKKKVFLKVDLFFVNEVPFFILLSRKIDFTRVIHLLGGKYGEIFKVFQSDLQILTKTGI